MKKNKSKNVLFVTLLLCLNMPLQLMANDEVAWQALRDGKAIAIMRHAMAPSNGVESDLTRDICNSERNLSQEGRDQAVKIGDLFRSNGVDQASIFTSSLCRSVDTATLLGFSQPELLPAINSFYDDQSSEPQQTAELNDWITQAIAQQASSKILVTHGFNISALTGTFVNQGGFLIIGMQNNELVTLANINTNVPWN